MLAFTSISNRKNLEICLELHGSNPSELTYFTVSDNELVWHQVVFEYNMIIISKFFLIPMN